MRRTTLSMLAIATVLLAATPVSAANEAIVFARVRGHSSAVEIAHDEGECRALADNAHYVLDRQPTYGGLVGVAMVAAIMPSYNAKTRTRALAACMRHRGYAGVTLTPSETDALASAPTDAARQAWIDAFLAGDIAGRIEVAATPVVPPLPPAEDRDAPFVVGAARMDPGSLSLATGDIGKGMPVLMGQLHRRRTAVLVEDYRDSIAMTVIRASAGTVFQEYLDQLPWDSSLNDDRTAWCGILQSTHRMVCIRSTMDGYELPLSTGEPWLVGAVGVENVFTRPFRKPIKLAVQSADPEGPLDFRLVVSRISERQVLLTATAFHERRSVDFWKGVAAFEADGRARLPFWDRTLILTRRGDSVTATFEPRADGLGWPDGPQPLQ